MNYYRASKLVDVYDKNQTKTMLQITGPLSTAFYRYYCCRWLAWYRIFYRLGDEAIRKKQITYFLDDLQKICK